MRNELDKLKDQVRTLKDDSSLRYESYNKQITQSEIINEDRLRQVSRENEILKEENETLRKS